MRRGDGEREREREREDRASKRVSHNTDFIFSFSSLVLSDPWVTRPWSHHSMPL